MSDFDEMPDVRILSQYRRRAARPHTCSTCRRPIEEGQTYTRTAFVEDGVFDVSREHDVPCWEVTP